MKFLRPRISLNIISFVFFCIIIPFDTIVSHVLTFHLILDNGKIFDCICLTVSLSKIKIYQRQR